ncbi:hypothetical protein CRT60_29635 [Azospirillum palustre]|uniref:ATPase AAA-type core domain-containing protein n=1 Tax=Azospirillum palustre TaxID=2044885 RepID=A0A2B8AYE6_9PROT|nr:ATP-binding protein [Azospirillum palustre]PGH53994.1 hypothetical protein CRT60_29635 [Azospirillum palustre]
MLRKIKIDRFKSVRDAELEFGRVNLFIGGNGAGKSNLLEAIGVMAAALNRGISDTELSRKGVRLTPAALMKSAFKNFDLPKTLRLEAYFSDDINYALELSSGEKNTVLSFLTEKAYHNGNKIFGRSGAGHNVLGNRITRKLDKQRSIWDQTRTAFDFHPEIQENFDALSRFAIYAPQTEFLREIRSGLISDPPIGLHGEGLSIAVSSFIAQYSNAYAKRYKEKGVPTEKYKQIKEALDLLWLPGWATAVKAGSIDPLLKSPGMASSEGQIVYFTDKYMHERRRSLSAYDSSEGTLFLLFMSILLCHEESPPIFSIDNVDNALNPALTRKLLEAMISILKRRIQSDLEIGPRQVFLTSHNPSSLDAFDLFDDDQRVFVVSRSDKGFTTANRLKPRAGWTRDEWTRAFKGKKMSQLWIDGEIQGAFGIQETKL